MITATVDLTNFNRGIRALVIATKQSAPIVLTNETIQLIKTLVNVTPPSRFATTPDKSSLEGKIETDIRRRFRSLSDESLSSTEGRVGSTTKSGLLLTGVSSRFLEGTAPASNKLHASIAELAALRWRITKLGRQSVSFFHPRKKQRMLLSQTITTSKTSLTKVVALAKKSVGRLKSGWAIAVGSGLLIMRGATAIPTWVLRHVPGSPSAFVDDSRNQTTPSMTIINRSKGVTHRTVTALVKRSVAIRAKAMANNALLFARGKKPIGEYDRINKADLLARLEREEKQSALNAALFDAL